MSELFSSMGVEIKQEGKDAAKNDEVTKTEENPETDNEVKTTTQPKETPHADKITSSKEVAKTEEKSEKDREVKTTSQPEKTPCSDEIASGAEAKNVESKVNPTNVVTANKNIKAQKAEKSEKAGRFSLSWGKIGKIALNSAKNFVKGMFCDENGFSVKRTLTTVGVVAGLTAAAPVAALLGASTGVVGAIGVGCKVVGAGLTAFMAYEGGKNTYEGLDKYYKSTTEEEATESMSQAMEGTVELAMVAPALFGLVKKGANKGIEMAKNRKASTRNADDSGKTGNSGKTGDSGKTGNSGKSGDSDKTGNSGKTGDSGKTDDSGKTGNSGKTDDSGKTGNSGKTGDSGKSGDSDKTGNSGKTGDSDKTGNSGKTGDSGKSGDAGKADEARKAKEEFINHIRKVLFSRRFKTKNLTDKDVRNLAKLFNITPEQVRNMDKAVYRKLALKYHPDRCVNEEEKEYFTFIQALYNGK
jgi:hypothetical protein